MESKFTHWKFDWEDDAPTAEDWTHCHGKRKRLFFKPWVPESGYVIALGKWPVMMFWIYFDPSCTVGHLDWVITRPGVSFHSVTKPAMAYAHHRPIKAAMIEHGADTLIVRGHRALTRHVPRGWYVNEEPLVSMAYIYNEEELEDV